MQGIPASIGALPTFTGAEFFLCDEMHLIARNISILVQGLIFTPDKFKGSLTTEYAFDLKSNINKDVLLGRVSEYMVSSRKLIPARFEGNWNGANSGYLRAVDRQDILLYVMPTMVLQHLRDQEATSALMSLINGCTIALQWSISAAEIRKMNRYLRVINITILKCHLTFVSYVISCFQAWHRYLNEQMQNERLNVRVFTANNHYLAHLAFIIKQVGPLKAYSCRSLERTIKKFRNLSRGFKDIGANTSNVISTHARYNTTYMYGIRNKAIPSKPYDEGSFVSHPSGDKTLPQLWSPISNDDLNGATDTVLVCCGVKKYKIVKALKKYYDRNYGVSNNVDIIESEITVAGNAWKDSVVISSAYSHRHKNVPRSRSNNIVLFEAQVSRYKIILL